MTPRECAALEKTIGFACATAIAIAALAYDGIEGMAIAGGAAAACAGAGAYFGARGNGN
jgi:hypothetical protein